MDGFFKIIQKVYEEFTKWLETYVPSSGDGDGDDDDDRSVLLATCGDWDLKTMLTEQLELSGLEDGALRPPALRRWANLKDIFTQETGVEILRATGMNDLEQMLAALGLRRRGGAHRADDDVRNTADVVRSARNCPEYCERQASRMFSKRRTLMRLTEIMPTSSI